MTGRDDSTTFPPLPDGNSPSIESEAITTDERSSDPAPVPALGVTRPRETDADLSTTGDSMTGASMTGSGIDAQFEEPANDEPDTLGAITRFFRGFVRDLAFFVGLFLFIYYFVMNVSVVRGKSMEPTFHDGDRLIVDKLSYRLGDIGEDDRFDVVVLKNPRDPSEDYIKRLVAFPGETVRIRDGVLYINGRRIDFDGAWLDHADYPNNGSAVHRVEEGHYFVLGDNRARSNDSRHFEDVPRDYIKGKIRVRFWPFDAFRFFGEPSEPTSEAARRQEH